MTAKHHQAPFEGLSKRAVEILRLLAEGMTDREIAERLMMTINTVKWYNRQIYSVLGVGSRTQAVARAHELQLLERNAGTESPQPASRRTLKHNLPVKTTRFIGREQELEVIKRLLESAHLLTLVGAPGTGKTRLALQAGAEVADSFQEGVYFVSLASINDPALVVNSIAVAVGVNEAHGRSIIETLKVVFRESHILLILDNFEHLLPAATQISELLAAAPHLKVLATSREPLHLYGEQEYTVLPLELPDLRHPEPANLFLCESTALFMQKARAVRPDFALTSKNAADIVDICIRLEGLPLAIELAAARIKMMTPRTLLARLKSRLDTLTGGAQDLHARQQTLHNTIEWSYNLLNEAEKALFASLAIFRGGHSLEAVEEICSPNLPLNILYGLESLVNKSLVQQTELPDGEPRFVMLETLREYAWERLSASSHFFSTAERHSAYYLAVVARHERDFYEEEPQAAVAAIRLELDNIRRAWRWAAEQQPASPALGAAIEGMAAFYETTSLFEEAQSLFAQAAENMTRVAEDGQSADGEDSQVVACHLLARVAEFTELRGEVENAYALAEQVVDMAARLNLPRYRADALRTLAILGRSSGEPERASEQLMEAIALYRSLGAKRPLAVSYDWLALISSDLRKLNEALDYLGQAAAFHAQVGYKRGIVFNMGMTAVVLSVMGRLNESLAYQREVLVRYQELDHPLGVARTVNNLGCVLLEMGEFEEALTQLEYANRLAHQISSKGLAYNALGNKGEVHLALDEYDEALHCFEQAGKYYHEMGMRSLECENLWRLGYLRINTGDDQGASAVLDECLALTPQKDDPEPFAIAHGLLAGIAWRAYRSEEATSHFDQAAAAFGAVRRPYTVARLVLLPRAAMLLEQGELSEAERALAEMQPLLESATGRNPILVEGQLLRAKLFYGRRDPEGGRRVLASLVEDRLRPAERAAVHYEWWRNEDDESHGREAHILYSQLADQSPKLTYHKRLAALQAAGLH